MDAAIQKLGQAIPSGLMPYALLQPRAQSDRLHHLERVVQMLLVDNTVSVERAVNGDLVITAGDQGAQADRKRTEAIRVLELARSMVLSIRQMLRMPRNCSRAKLNEVRRDLTPYVPIVVVATSSATQHRSAAVAPLTAVVTTQVALSMASGNLALPIHLSNTILVLICPDATPLWRTSATKCDIFVSCWAGGAEVAGDVRRWACWWAMDGPDNSNCLRALDVKGDLNAQVADLENVLDVMVGGVQCRYVCILTGDGKAMQASNKGGGCLCWLCNSVESLEAVDFVDADVRWGAFLRQIPPCRRIGDFVHAQCRIANAFIKRLTTMLQQLIASHGPSARAAMAELKKIQHDLVEAAKAIPEAERLQKKEKPGTLDITTARLFWDDGVVHSKIVAVLERHFGREKRGGVFLHILVRYLLSSFSQLHALWRVKTWLTNHQVAQCKLHARKFAECWGKLQWKPTVWVHWTCAHSGLIVATYRSMYIFSSIPCEHRNRPFKRGLKNSMRGWSLRKPRLTHSGLRHVVAMDALDVGLQGEKVRREGKHLLLQRKKRKHC